MDRREIEKILEQDFFDIPSICNIFGQSNFNALLDKIEQLNRGEKKIIFSQTKKFNLFPLLCEPGLNENGLHIFRMTLAFLIYKKRFGLMLQHAESESYYDSLSDFLSKGYLLIENFLGEKEFRKTHKSFQAILGVANPNQFLTRKYYIELSPEHGKPYEFFSLAQIQPIFKTVNATEDFSFHAKRIERVVHKNEDIQKELHEDTFHPTVKCWFYFNDVDVVDGPTHYSVGSCIPNLHRFEWEFYQSLNASTSSIQGTAEGSFRVTDYEIKNMGYSAMKPMTCKENSFAVFNTMGFHCRGQATPGTTRDSMMGIFRMNPFVI